jgi:RNA polymerase sigma factor (sigma-70 family)
MFWTIYGSAKEKRKDGSAMTLLAPTLNHSDSSDANPSSSRKHLSDRTRELMTTEISFVFHRRDLESGVALDGQLIAELAEIAARENSARSQELVLLPGATGRILERDEEQRLFRRMNYLKWRANIWRSRLDSNRPSKCQIESICRLLSESEQIRTLLVESNLRLVLSIARKHSHSFNQFEEFVSEGFTILLRCIDLFDVSHGYRFSTYLTHSVQRHLYRCLFKAEKHRKRQATTDVEILANVPDPQPDSELSPDASLICGKILQTAADRLDPRETTIITRRFGLDGSRKQNLREIADDLGLSKERVRQLQMRALKKLQDVAASMNVSIM